MNSESITVPPPQKPDLSEEKAQRTFHRDILAAWFQSHPLQEIDPDELERLVGRNYQQRVSDCRTELRLNICNVPRFLALAHGKRKRLSGGYLFKPYRELGPDANTSRGQMELGLR
jgi:hypothetical protein